MPKHWIAFAAFSFLLFSSQVYSQSHYYYDSSNSDIAYEYDPDYPMTGAFVAPTSQPYYAPKQAVYKHHHKRQSQPQAQEYYTESEKEYEYNKEPSGSYFSRLPQYVSQKEKMIVVDPRKHAWGAYANGALIKAGLATAGSGWCSDLGRPCKTGSGYFRIQSLGSEDCYSKKFPLGEGGAPMPYCMYFNGGQGIHGSHELGEGNYSHGCVRISVDSARWLRYNFAQIGTKVVIKPY